MTRGALDWTGRRGRYVPKRGKSGTIRRFVIHQYVLPSCPVAALGHLCMADMAGMEEWDAWEAMCVCTSVWAAVDAPQ